MKKFALILVFGLIGAGAYCAWKMLRSENGGWFCGGSCDPWQSFNAPEAEPAAEGEPAVNESEVVEPVVESAAEATVAG